MSLKNLADLATKLDAEGNTKAASAIDAAIMKLAADGELIDFPSLEDAATEEGFAKLEMPPLSDDINEYGEEGQLEALIGFAEALIGGAFETMEEAQDAAKHFMDQYGSTPDEPLTDDVGIPDEPAEREFEEGFEKQDILGFPGA